MSKDIKTLQLRLIELFGLLEYKPKQMNERIERALGCKKEIFQMTATEIQKVTDVTKEWISPNEYNHFLDRLTKGAEKIEKLDRESDQFKNAVKLYNRLEALVRELNRGGLAE